MSNLWFLLICFNIFVPTPALHKIKEWKEFLFPEKYMEMPKFCFCKCGLSNVQRVKSDTIRHKRLLGGENIEPHQFPWLVTVHVEASVVGGSLISDKHVLTAATALYGKSAAGTVVSLGVHDRCGMSSDPTMNISVASVMIHPSYSTTNTNHDIALLKLQHSVPFGRLISPICLQMYPKFKEFDQVAWTVAWDLKDLRVPSSSCTPKVAAMPILSTSTCSKATSMPSFTPDKGCLGPLGARSIVCKSDEGFPVMTRWSHKGAYKLIGVISAQSSCDNTSTPFFTKVIDHAPWIHEQIKNDCQCF